MNTKYDGQYLVYNRRSKRLWFKPQPLDNATHLNIGCVVKGVVAGQPIEYWIVKMEVQKPVTSSKSM